VDSDDAKDPQLEVPDAKLTTDTRSSKHIKINPAVPSSSKVTLDMLESGEHLGVR
jgi:hypothetical protein